MGKDYQINGKLVSNQEFEELRRVFLQTPRKEIVKEGFADGEVSSAEIDQFLDFDEDGRARITDWKVLKGPEASKIFSDIKSLLRRYDFRLEDHIIVPINGYYWPESWPSYIRSDRDMFLVAVKQFAYDLKCADENFRKDWEIVLAAVKENSLALRFADDALQTDPLFLAEAVLVDFNVVRSISDRELQQRVWKNALETLHREGLAFPKEMEVDIAGFVNGLRDRQITEFPRRFRSLKTIHAIWQNKEKAPPPDKPVALLICTKNDEDRAFAQYPLEDRFVESGLFHVLYYEVSEEKDVYRLLKEVSKGGKQPIHTLVLAGHGTKETLALDGKDDWGIVGLGGLPIEGEEALYIDVRDFRDGEWDQLDHYLSPTGQVLLASCSNGKGGEGSDNLANAFLKKVSKGVRIYSAQGDTNISNLVIHPDLSLDITLEDGVDAYNPTAR